MKALVFRPGQSHRVEDVEIDAARDREVLVRVVAAGICHSDLHFMAGRNNVPGEGLYARARNRALQPGMWARHSEEAEAPTLVMGHEPAGIVEAVGPGVRSLEPGDRVVGAGTSHCGTCDECLLGRPNLCLSLPRRQIDDVPRLSQNGLRITQFANLGAFAERMLVDESSLVRIDVDIPFASAAIAGCSVATGMGAVLNTARVAAGSTVAIFGVGGIGLAMIQAARLAGAVRIVAIDVHAAKVALARDFGATDVVDASIDDPVSAIFELTRGRGVDYSFDTTSVPAATQQAYDCLGLRGTLTCLTGPPGNIETIVGTERRVQGSRFGSTRLQVDLPRYFELYRRGFLMLDEMVSLKVPPEGFDKAAQALVAGEVARAVVVFPPGLPLKTGDPIMYND